MRDEQILPFHIGIAPEEQIILKDVRPERKPKLVLAGGPVDPPTLVGIDGEALNPLTWASYAAWRRTKCRPYDHATCPALATTVSEDTRQPHQISINEQAAWHESCGRQRGIEEIDQATHEFIGETGELGELFTEIGPGVFFGDSRAKLIDECGDIFFCAMWALDAWGHNPFDDAKIADLELVRVDDDDNPLAKFAVTLANYDPEVLLASKNFVQDIAGLVMPMLVSAMSSAALTANSFKKLRFQRREQKVEIQVERIVTTLFMVNQILIIANSSVEEALISNQRKLNARFPDGYKPGVGGGIRTGEGK
jgi:hypothetical protein